MGIQFKLNTERLTRVLDRALSERLRKAQEDYAEIENERKREAGRREKEKHEHEAKLDELDIETREIENDERREQLMQLKEERKQREEDRKQREEDRLWDRHARSVSGTKHDLLKKLIKEAPAGQLRLVLQTEVSRLFEGLETRPSSHLLIEPEDDDGDVVLGSPDDEEPEDPRPHPGKKGRRALGG